MYPVVSETYIGEDIDALWEAGAEVSVTVSAGAGGLGPWRAGPCLSTSTVIEAARPDVALLHWATHCEGQIPLLESMSSPSPVVSIRSMPNRTWSKGFDHPLCIGVMVYPHQVGTLPAGVTRSCRASARGR